MSIKFRDKTFRTPEEQIKKNMENIESINKVDTDFEKRIVKLEEGGTIAKEYIDSKVSTLENEISTNKTNISTNEQNITTNANTIETLTSKLSTLENEISTNKTNISTNEQNITTNANTIETLTSKLSTLENVADNAKTTADNAMTTADNAKTTADNANTTADNAMTTADNAMTTATEALSYIQNFCYNFMELNYEHDIYIITFISAIAPDNFYLDNGFDFLLHLCDDNYIVSCYCQKLNSEQIYYCFERNTNENEIKLTSSFDLSYLYLNRENTDILSFTFSRLHN